MKTDFLLSPFTTYNSHRLNSSVLAQNKSTNFNSLSDEVVDEFVRSICWQWGTQNGYPVEEFGCVNPGSSFEGVKRWRDELVEFAYQRAG